MKQPSPAIKDALLLIDTSHETNRQLHTALGGVFDLVFTPSSTKELSATLARTSPRLIIFELHDVANKGFEQCREIAFHQTNGDIPIVVIINSRDVGLMSTGFYMGVADYMVKPLVPAEVLTRVGGQLEMASAQRALKDTDVLYNTVNDEDRSNTQDTQILLVDDCQESLEPLAQALALYYTVHTASTGQQAIDRAQKTAYDLIVLDVVMPDMNGFDVCKKLKATRQTEDIPVIFLSGQSEPKHELLGLNIGAVDYITKPASLSNLMARIRGHLNLAQKHKALAALTYLDPVTRIPNRTRFNEVYSQEFKRSMRGSEPLALLMIDVDQFKLFNDHFGHVQGDKCLRAISEAMNQSRQRASDFVGRYGGEEFSAILPGTDIEGARHVSKRMLEAVKRLGIPQAPDATHPFVTISIGIAVKVTGGRACSNPESLVALADKQLYQAKHCGRDTACAAVLDISYPEVNIA